MKLKNDFFWKSYCRHFESADLPVQPPPNFCVYFWRGVGGTCLRMGGSIADFFKRTPAWKCPIWSSLAISPVVGLALLDSYKIVQTGDNFWVLMGTLPFTLFFLLMLVAGPVKFGMWLWKKITERADKKVQKGIEHTFFAIMGWGLLSLILNTPELAKGFGKIAFWFPVFLVCVTVAALALALLGLGIGWLFSHAGSLSMCQNIGHYLKTVKSKICPIVEPPDEFLEEERKRQGCSTISGNSSASLTTS